MNTLRLLFLFPLLFSAAGAAEKPNILFILLDDLGKEWVSAYGADDIETPNIDRLARDGLQLSNFYSMPQCTPTRVAFMTGQYPFRNGWVNHWDVPRWGGGCHFDAKRNPSVARVMQSAGYRTAVAGKWQINDFRVQPDAMVQHGFEDFCMWTGYEGGNPPSGERYWDPYIHTKKGSRTYEGRFGEDVFADFLIGFMKEHRDEPMFLYYPMCLPHGPLVHTPLHPKAKEKYDKHKAMVLYCDHILGRLVGALDDLGLRKNTIVVWSTDNGTAGGLTGTLNGRRVKGGKAKTTENGICAPTIVNCPGRVPVGTSDALGNIVDLLPTFAELGGATLPEGVTFDGVSNAKHWLGQADDTPRKWNLAMGGRNEAKLTDQGVQNKWWYRDRVIRDKRYKLFVGTDGAPAKLVDVLADPEEKDDLKSNPEFAEVVNRLLAPTRGFPKRDLDPVYDALPPEKWDVPVKAKSLNWKSGRP